MNFQRAIVTSIVSLLLVGPGLAYQKPPADWRVLSDYDSRATQEVGSLSFAQTAALARLDAERRADVSLQVDAREGTVRSLFGMGVPVWRPEERGATSPVMSAFAFLRENASLLGVEPGLELELTKARYYATESAGLVHVFLGRSRDGFPVFQGELRVHLNARGEVIAATSTGLAPFSIMNDRLLSPAEAYAAAASTLGYQVTPEEVKRAAGVTVFAHGPFQEDVAVEPFIFIERRGQAVHAYRVVMHEHGLGNWYETLVDAASGRLLFRYNWTRYIQGRVFDEHPDAGAQVMRTFPAGWVASNTTIGNNVSAQEDANANNSGGYRPTTNASGNFDFTVNLGQDPRNFQDAAITNLFYWNNLIHDWWYTLGFTEAAGNFQTNNFGNGGSGNDPVQADAQDGSGTNNANFATPPDGSSPRMQMYLFTSPNPDRDGDYDADVMIHEYGHGLSNRLVGGPSNASCLNTYQGGAMGEGWGDWYAASYFDDAVMGEYVTLNTSTGIRQYRMDRSPLTFTDYKNGRTEVHDAGEIWAATLWDVRAALIGKLGQSAGRTMAEQLVMDGMKLMGCNGGFLQARDGILQADQNRNGGAYKCDLWTVFAARGFGASAASSSANSTSTVSPAFDVPGSCGGVGGATETEPNNSTSQANPIGSGLLLTAKIGTSTDKDYFKFTINTTGSIALTMTVPSNKDYDVKLLDSSGAELARSERGTGQSEAINYSATKTGTYYVFVYGYAGAYSTTSDYTVKVTYPTGSGDPTPPTVSITSPTQGQTVSGSITIAATASDNVGVTMVEVWIDSGTATPDTTSPYSWSLDTTKLSNGNHTATARAWDAAGNSATTPARTFNVQNGGGGGGSMNESEPNNSTSQANTIATSGTTVTGYISTSSDLDYFRISVGAGRTIRLDMTVPSNKDYDLYLYNSAGSQVGYSIQNTGLPEQIIYTNTSSSTQTFYIKVLGYNGAYSTSSPYQLTAQF